MDRRERNKERRLHFIDEIDNSMQASDNPDVRGWDVVDTNNNSVGKVDNLLVDPEAEKIRYLDVAIDKNLLREDHEPFAQGKPGKVHEYENREGEAHMIIPIGLAKIDSSEKKIISNEINHETFRNGHLHSKGEEITPEHERSVITTLSDAERRMAESKRYRSDMKNREMRRPESSKDTRLTQEAKRKERLKDTTELGKYASDKDRPYNEDSWSLETHRNERLSRSSETRGPIQTNFYTHRYFNEDTFWGRK